LNKKENGQYSRISDQKQEQSQSCLEIFNSILIYLHANLTAQGQLQSEHELRYRNKCTQIKPQCDSEEQVSSNNNNNNNINNNINNNNGINNNDNNNSLTNSV
jgi:hypothetical protein